MPREKPVTRTGAELARVLAPKDLSRHFGPGVSPREVIAAIEDEAAQMTIAGALAETHGRPPLGGLGRAMGLYRRGSRLDTNKRMQAVLDAGRMFLDDEPGWRRALTEALEAVL